MKTYFPAIVTALLFTSAVVLAEDIPVPDFRSLANQGIVNIDGKPTKIEDLRKTLDARFNEAHLPDDPKVMVEESIPLSKLETFEISPDGMCVISTKDAKPNDVLIAEKDGWHWKNIDDVMRSEKYRIEELERKVSGMQKVINELFARVEKLENPKVNVNL